MFRPPSGSGVARVSALLLTAACGGDGGSEPNPGTGPHLSGLWTLAESFRNDSRGIVCTNTAILTLDSTAQGFNGTVNQQGICQTPSGPVDNSGVGNLTEGRTTDTTVTFRQPGCRYSGRLYHDPPDSADGTLTCTATTGVTEFKLTGSWYMLPGGDFDPPAVTDALLLQNYPIIPGDTVGIDVGVRDDAGLAWVGFRLGDPLNLEDSIPVSGTSDRDTLEVKFPLGWTGTVEVSLFARDRVNRLWDVPWDSLPVVDLMRRPIHAIDVQGESSTGAYDAKRNRFYIPQSASARIAVVDLASSTLATPISLSPVFQPRGTGAFNLDITAGMDSLVITSMDPGDPTMAVLDLVAGTLTPVALSDSGLTLSAQTPLLTTHDRVLLFGRRYDTPLVYAQGLWSYDLKAGTTRRQQVGIVDLGPPARSGDRKTAVIFSLAPRCAWRYDPAVDTIGACQGFAPVTGYGISTDSTGNLWLAAGDLFDANFALLRNLSQVTSNPGALTPDGSAAWYGDYNSVTQVRTSDAAVLMTVRVPNTYAGTVKLLSDTHRLVVFNSPDLGHITVVDLP